jgi:chitodextrinase
MTKKSRAVLAITLTVLLLGFATLVWANQTGKLNIFGAVSLPAPEFKCSGDAVMVGLYGNTSVLCSGVNLTPVGPLATLDNQTVSNEAPYSGWNNTTLICPGSKFVNGIVSYIPASDPGVAKQLYCVDLKANNSVMARGETKKLTLTQQAFASGAYLSCGSDYYMYGIEIQNYPSYPLKEMGILCAKAVATDTNQQTGSITLNGTAQCDKSGGNAVNELSWAQYSGAAGYTLLRDGASIAELSSGSIGRIDSSMGAGSHAYQVSAKNSSGTTIATSNIVTLTTSTTCSAITITPGSEYTFTMTKNYCGTDGQISEFTTTVPSNLYNMIDVRLTYNNIGVGQAENKQSYSIAWKKFLDPGDTRFNQVYFDLMYGSGFTDPNIKWAGAVAANGATVGQISGLPSGQDHQGLIVPRLSCPVSTAQADTQVPSTPVLTAAADGQTNINLSWTASTDNVGVTGYDIYNADNNQLINSTPNTSYTVTGATCATTYNYYVIARDAAGNVSANSNTASATTGACTPAADTEKPTKPTNVVATSISCHNVGLSWTKSTDNVGVTGYDIYNANNDKLITTSNDNYEFNGLSENTDYSYYLVAHDAAGNSSDKSDTASIKSQSCPVSVTTSSVNVSSLVSTGGVLWFNILIALIIAGVASYLLLRQREEK